FGWGRLQLRQRPVPRVHGRPTADQAHRGCGADPGRRRLLARRVRRGRLLLRDGPLLWVDRRDEAQPAHPRRGFELSLPPGPTSGRRHAGWTAMPTMGWFRWMLPVEPRNGAFPKAN